MFTLVQAGWIVGAGIFAAVLVLLELGRWLGIRSRARQGEKAGAGLGALEGGIFALMGLLVAFTFSGAATRFDIRRNLIVEEANDIGTAYLRVDLLPAETQPAIRDVFRRYVEARIETFGALPDTVAAKAANARAMVLQAEIWQRSVAAAAVAPTTQPTMLLIPALNAMIDITTTRAMALRTHPPALVFLLLAVLVGTGALLAGFGMAANPVRSWVHVLGFAAITAVTLLVIVDFELPRLGMIQVMDFDQVLVQVRNSMN